MAGYVGDEALFENDPISDGDEESGGILPGVAASAGELVLAVRLPLPEVLVLAAPGVDEHG